MSTILDSIIIGSGQAGLVTGYYLQQHGLTFVILDANGKIIRNGNIFDIIEDKRFSNQK